MSARQSDGVAGAQHAPRALLRRAEVLSRTCVLAELVVSEAEVAEGLQKERGEGGRGGGRGREQMVEGTRSHACGAGKGRWVGARG